VFHEIALDILKNISNLELVSVDVHIQPVGKAIIGIPHIIGVVILFS
jgi:hypothetical protein